MPEQEKKKTTKRRRHSLSGAALESYRNRMCRTTLRRKVKRLERHMERHPHDFVGADALDGYLHAYVSGGRIVQA